MFLIPEQQISRVQELGIGCDLYLQASKQTVHPGSSETACVSYTRAVFALRWPSAPPVACLRRLSAGKTLSSPSLRSVGITETGRFSVHRFDSWAACLPAPSVIISTTWWLCKPPCNMIAMRALCKGVRLNAHHPTGRCPHRLLQCIFFQCFLKEKQGLTLPLSHSSLLLPCVLSSP